MATKKKKISSNLLLEKFANGNTSVEVSSLTERVMLENLLRSNGIEYTFGELPIMSNGVVVRAAKQVTVTDTKKLAEVLETMKK